MAKSLVITEKPSVARDIADALGGFTEHDGYFESDDLGASPSPSATSSSCCRPRRSTTSTSAGRSTCCRSCRTSSATRPKQGQTERVRTIRKLLERNDVDTVINACDAGREGELIFREIVEHLGSQKPIRRLWLQSMTDEAIRDGFSQAAPGRGAPGPRRRRRLPRAVRLADRHERHARAHQAAQEPQGEDGVVGGPRADADARDAGRQGDRGPRARAAPVLARDGELRARRPALRRRPGSTRASRRTTTASARTTASSTRRARRRSSRRCRGARARPRRRASRRASRRRRSST